MHYYRAFLTNPLFDSTGFACPTLVALACNLFHSSSTIDTCILCLAAAGAVMDWFVIVPLRYTSASGVYPGLFYRMFRLYEMRCLFWFLALVANLLATFF